MAGEIDLQEQVQPLRKRITDTMKTWNECPDKPPFSQGELIVMALLLHDMPLTRQDIMKWIVDTFKYFRDLVALTFCEDYLTPRRRGRRIGQSRANEYMREFRDAFRKFELPIRTSKQEADGEETFMATMPDAATYLQDKVDGPRRGGAFPFFKLPAELRTTIYEMVLQYPSSGLYPVVSQSREDNKIHFIALTRDMTKTFSLNAWSDWFDADNDFLDDRPIGNILALLRASKQIYQEAGAVFYSNNKFVFVSVGKLFRVLNALSPTRRHDITHLAFKYHSCDADLAPATFKLLAEMSNLLKLHISVDEDTWYNSKRGSGIGSVDIQKIAGLNTLHKIRGLTEVVLEGNCPNVAAYLKQEMEKPKLATAPRPESRKRKVSGEGKRKQPDRAAKARETDTA